MAVDESKNSIDQIVDELCSSTSCVQAVAYYENLGVDIRQDVLARGSTDFDRAYGDEDCSYKIDAYIHQYMQMHYQRNLAVFEKCAFLSTAKPTLFIDFGCGPMMAGLALLRRLDSTAGQNRVSYWGIDVSQRMLDKCKRINHEFQLYRNVIFSSDLSSVAVNNQINSDFLVVINFGYVLSAGTLKFNSIKQVSDEAIMVCESALLQVNSMYVIYQNPVVKNPGVAETMHGNWKNLRARVEENFAIRQQYEGKCPYTFSGFRKTTEFAKLQIGKKDA